MTLLIYVTKSAFCVTLLQTVCCERRAVNAIRKCHRNLWRIKFEMTENPLILIINIICLQGARMGSRKENDLA